MTLKFNPVCYFHVFVFGMLLARTRYLVSIEIAKASSRAGVGFEPGSSLEQIATATRPRRFSLLQNARRRISGIRQSFRKSFRKSFSGTLPEETSPSRASPHPSQRRTGSLQSATATGVTEP